MLLCRRAPPGISSENNILMYVRIYRSFFLPLASSFPCFSSLSLSHPAGNFSLTRNFFYIKNARTLREPFLSFPLHLFFIKLFLLLFRSSSFSLCVSAFCLSRRFWCFCCIKSDGSSAVRKFVYWNSRICFERFLQRACRCCIKWCLLGF